MQICEQTIDKAYNEFRACMNNKELMLLYAAISTTSNAVIEAFINTNFPTYESAFYIDGDVATLTGNLQQILTQNGLIGG